jgi:AcrR family transcriptional regulator
MQRVSQAAAPKKDAAEARILDAAWRLYAEDGLDVPLARIARAARVSPAVMKQSVPGRKALVDRVFKRLFEARWKAEWEVLLVNRKIPLEKRLSRFFTEYRGNIDRLNARLWTRAGLMGLHAKGNFSGTLAKRILGPMIQEMRHDIGLPAKSTVTGKELEVAMVVHAAIAFPHTRSFIFGMDVHGSLEELVPMMVRVWLPGAKAELKRLNAAKRKPR